MKIRDLKARKILNSEANWTIEAVLETETGEKTIASVPQGISRGKGEKKAIDLETAVKQIGSEILPQVKGRELTQESLDQLLTQGKWGSNATLAVSAAFFKLDQDWKRQKKPQLMILIFEGEKHGNPDLTIQEFMILVDQIDQGVDFYQKTEAFLKQKGVIDTVGSEGGFSPKEFNEKDILEIMKTLGAEKISLDIAGNVNPPTLDSLLEIVRRYPIFSLEDPLPETEAEKWQEFFLKAKEINPEILIIADDLTVTDPKKIKFWGGKLFNGVIIKPNQQGTISAAIKALEAAKELKIRTIVSHRGEETNDDWIVDFALKFGADFVKFGAPARGERIAKYNRLLKIGEEDGKTN